MGNRRGGSEGEGDAGRVTIRPKTLGAARKAPAKRRPAKTKSAGKWGKRPAKRAPSGSEAPAGCPDTPKEFFAGVHAWSLEFLLWASEVDSCWETTCGTQESTRRLRELCRDFSAFAQDAKDWGDEVERCFADQCNAPPGHTQPPPPPF